MGILKLVFHRSLAIVGGNETGFYPAVVGQVGRLKEGRCFERVETSNAVVLDKFAGKEAR